MNDVEFNTTEPIKLAEGGVCAHDGNVLVSHPAIWPEYMVFSPLKAREFALKLLEYAREAAKERIAKMGPGPDADDDYGYDPAQTQTCPDNDFWDGTDAAHPAWWRGQERGAKGMLDRVRASLRDRAQGHEGGGDKEVMELVDQIVHHSTEVVREAGMRLVAENCNLALAIPPEKRAALRPHDFERLTPQEQWEIDKRLGILDWDGKESDGNHEEQV